MGFDLEAIDARERIDRNIAEIKQKKG